MKCSACERDMDQGFMYVRGLGGALFWSRNKEARFWSRQGLEQVDLAAVSVTGVGAQAVLEAWRCGSCGLLTFRSGAGSDDRPSVG